MFKAKLKAGYVRELLLRRNLSQGNFASRITVTGGYCSQLMNGNRCPSPRVRERILRELRADFEEVFEVIQPQEASCAAE